MTLQRQSGVALWRQIADEIRGGIGNGLTDKMGRLPSEAELARRFDVNRHTVRAALAALARERVVEARRGQGTFALKKNRIAYPIGRRTRFSAAMRDNSATGRSEVISSTKETADAPTRTVLRLEPGAIVLRLETLSMVDGEPFSFSTHWFEAGRFEALPEIVRQTGSITAGLKACGVDDYLRQETRVDARHARDAEIERLRLAPGAILLVTGVVNCDLSGVPIQRSRSCFAADRATLIVDHLDSAGS
ncbi:MAG: phosphonate metabolism transcriptional regulator PhnF [Roseibium sp.]|nr:phosphonate metabolism transcriptional regulator PhnF [Roseibium sp.]